MCSKIMCKHVLSMGFSDKLPVTPGAGGQGTRDALLHVFCESAVSLLPELPPVHVLPLAAHRPQPLQSSLYKPLGEGKEEGC